MSDMNEFAAERHPKGLYVLFFTEMWERFGFYSMLAMFTLYLKDDKQGFGWSSEDATSLYANYLMFVYASPLIGGWIADKKLGYRNSVLIGGVIFMVGYFLLTIHSIAAVYAALTCLVIGNGFFKPNVSAIVGHQYPEGSTLKDRAYNIFYMGINIGALLAPINAEIMVHRIGFNWAFGIAGIGMIISVAILWGFRHYLVGEERPGKAAPAEATPEADAITADVPPPQPARSNPIDAVPEATRVGALIVIFVIVIVFWMVFHQNGSTITYWADDNTDWNVSGIISNAINPFWVVTLTFPLVWFWRWLAGKGLEPSTPTKMALGMFLTAVSFTILYLAARTGETQQVTESMLAEGDFLITDRSLNAIEGELKDRQKVVMAELNQKNSKGKYVIKGRKFTTDLTFEDALDTIRHDFAAEAEQTQADLRRHREEDKTLQEAAQQLVGTQRQETLDRLERRRAGAAELREKAKRAAEDVKALKDVQIQEGEFPPIADRGRGDPKFSAALQEVVAAAQKEGLSSTGAEALRRYSERKLTGREKLHQALARRGMLGIEDAARFGPAIEKPAYLFKVSPLWLILAVAVVTLGELMLSPMGLSLVSKVAPVHLRGLMMGGWFVATAIGNKLTAIGVFWEQWMQSTFFLVLGGMSLAMALVLVALLKPLKKAMPGV